MARRRRKRQARKRAKPVMMFRARLRLGRPVPLGGGLFARLDVWTVEQPVMYRVELTLRTRGSGDVALIIPHWRGSAEEAALHAEELLTNFASALRRAGAT